MVSVTSALREIAQDLFLTSLAACSVERAFARKVRSLDEDGRRILLLGQDRIDLSQIKRVAVIAAGKAAAPMLDALLPHLQSVSQIDLTGVLAATERPQQLAAGFQFFSGGHPLPNEASFRSAQAALQLIHSLKRGQTSADDALCLFLLSGGGSAMFELPLDPDVSLDDTVSFYRELVHSGGSIAEINCVRKHFSAVKGGRLAMAAQGIPSYSLLVSDVPAGHLDVLASGPTLPDTSTVEGCREILGRHALMERFPASVRRFFDSPKLVETPKPNDLSARVVTLLDSNDMAEIAKERAEALGFYTVVDNACDDWDSRTAAEYLVHRLRELRRKHGRVCVLSAGEVTVKLPPANRENPPGMGGRNQHFALYAATLLDPSDASVVILSAGTDGIDGNSSAAGAIVDERTLVDAGDSGMSTGRDRNLLLYARKALEGFDSGTFLQEPGSIVVTGPTGNNLRDLRILLCAQPS